MRLGRLPIEVEGIDCPFTFTHVDLLFGYPLYIERHVLVQTRDIEILPKFLVDLAGVCLVYPQIPRRFFIEVGLLLDSGQDIGNCAAPRHQNLDDLL